MYGLRDGHFNNRATEASQLARSNQTNSHTHAHTHTHVSTWTHAHTCSFASSLTCARTHTHTHTHTHMHAHVYTWTHAHTHSFARSLSLEHARTYTHIHAHTDAHTHAHTHTYGMRQKNLPCTVRFTLDRLMKTEVKRLLNGLRTDIERTVHGPFHFTYVRTTRVLQLHFMRVQCKYLSRISNSASRLLVCNREVERDPVLKP